MLPDLMDKLPEIIELARVLGQERMIVTVPKGLVGPAEEDRAGGVACADRHQEDQVALS
jgi:hypothetical protein